MVWSPENAMNAYLHTLKLVSSSTTSNLNKTSTRVIEPESLELISAMAAGNRARLMVEITSEGVSLMTVALAVAAKQTGGRLVCVVPRREEIEKGKALISSYGLCDHDEDYAIEFVVADQRLCEKIKHDYKNIDFAIIDCRVDDHLMLCKVIDLNPSGSVVVMVNLGADDDHQYGRGCATARSSYAKVFKGRRGGIESVVNNLPIGEGMELMRIGFSCKHDQSKRFRRFYMTTEN